MADRAESFWHSHHRERKKGGEGRSKEYSSFPVPELIGQPVRSLIEPISTGGTAGLNVPFPWLRVYTQLVCDLGCIHGIGEVLLANTSRKGVLGFIFCKHPHVHLTGLIHTQSLLSTTKMRPYVIWKQWHHRCWILSWPPMSHRVKLMFLYSTVSMMKPIVIKISPSFTLYRVRVFPTASRLTMRSTFLFWQKGPWRGLQSYSLAQLLLRGRH